MLLSSFRSAAMTAMPVAMSTLGYPCAVASSTNWFCAATARWHAAVTGLGPWWDSSSTPDKLPAAMTPASPSAHGHRRLRLTGVAVTTEIVSFMISQLLVCAASLAGGTYRFLVRGPVRPPWQDSAFLNWRAVVHFSRQVPGDTHPETFRDGMVAVHQRAQVSHGTRVDRPVIPGEHASSPGGDGTV